eukprot:8997823-Pyramimonas_sp.AAC.1
MESLLDITSIGTGSRGLLTMNGTICLTGPGCQSGGMIIISRRERRHWLEVLTEREGGLARLVVWTYRREDRRLQIRRLWRRPGESSWN